MATPDPMQGVSGIGVRVVVGRESDNIKDRDTGTQRGIAGSENVGFPFVRPPSAHSIPRLECLAL